MNSNKVLGLDGMASIFFPNYWDMVRKDVIEAALETLNVGTLRSLLNHTFITLVSKKKRPKKIFDFCPISLCNVLYKIIAKVIANRLKIILPHVISPTQVLLCLIALLPIMFLLPTNSCITSIIKGMEKKKFMSLKLDISKTYDRVEWPFLDQVMRKMRSGEFWI